MGLVVVRKPCSFFLSFVPRLSLFLSLSLSLCVSVFVCVPSTSLSLLLSILCVVVCEQPTCEREGERVVRYRNGLRTAWRNAKQQHGAKTLPAHSWPL